MRESDRQQGWPFRAYRETKANIEALGAGGIDEGCFAYATDTNEVGTFNGATWSWGIIGSLPGVAGSGYALVSSGINNWVADLTPLWLGTHTWGSGLAIMPTDATGQDLGDATHRWDLHTQSVLFEGATGNNTITITDNLANALHIIDNVAGDVFLQIVTTTDSEEVIFNAGGDDVDFTIQSDTHADAFQIQGSDGQITLGVLTEGLVKSTVGGVLSVLASPGAAGYALVSGAATFAWDQTPAWTGRHSFADGITFNGIAGANSVVIPDALADAFDITNGVEFLRLDTTSDYFLIDPAGAGIKVGIGVSDPGTQLEAHASAGSNVAFWLSDADVSHPFTGIGFVPEIQSDVIAAWVNVGGTQGGFDLIGFTDTDIGAARINAHVGSATPTSVAIAFRAWKTDGGVSRTALTGTEPVFQISTGMTTLFSVIGNGRIGVNKLVPIRRFEVETDDAALHAAYFFNDGNNINRYGIGIKYGQDDQSATTNYPVLCYDGAGNPRGGLKCTNNVMSIYNPSDAALKMEVKTLIDGLQKILALRPVEFNWKENPKGPRVKGFVAQEAQGVVPDMVCELPEGILAISPGTLIPFLTGAIQELEARLVKLEAA